MISARLSSSSGFAASIVAVIGDLKGHGPCSERTTGEQRVTSGE